MAHPLAEHLVLCMNFNEQGSRVMDLSPSGAHGRLSGFGSPAKRHIQGLDFIRAIPSYVEIPAAFTQLNFTSEDFSIIVRCYIDALANHTVFFARGLYQIDGYRMLTLSNGTFDVGTYQNLASQDTVSAVGVVTTGSWLTLGFSRSGATITLYKNGADATDTPAGHINPTTSARTAKMGIDDNRIAYPLDGKMEFLYVWRKRKLSEADHKAIHEQPNAPYGYNLFL